MTESKRKPCFNLWAEPWITTERAIGGVEQLGIERTLLRAHELTALYDPSPLVVVGIHRLLTAILQAVCSPQRPSDLKKLWQARRFPVEAVQTFGKQYGERFDLFSDTAPFLQSADLPLQPAKGDNLKSVSQLTAETSRSTAIEHYRHGRAFEECFCPACAAAGMVTIPSFTSSGGRGLKPSINGVPPIYILPGGSSIFESLVASLLLPDYQPKARSLTVDNAWWVRTPVVLRSQEVSEVGYLHSLTFSARRVRLHPEPMASPCTRCGQESTWGVRTIIFEMGESRPRDAPFWQDPFVAYKKTGEKDPIPIRPSAGKALWREFVGLFLSQTSKSSALLRPRMLDQIADPDVDLATALPTYPFRCIGVRTDMKAKVFEWIDAGFDVPPSLLRDDDAALHVANALQFATDCMTIIAGVFRDTFSGTSKKQERHHRMRERMRDEYWATLAAPFRQYILNLSQTAPASEKRTAESERWADVIAATARTAFVQAAASVGEDAEALHRQVQGEQQCNARLAGRRSKFWKGDVAL